MLDKAKVVMEYEGNKYALFAYKRRVTQTFVKRVVRMVRSGYLGRVGNLPVSKYRKNLLYKDVFKWFTPDSMRVQMMALQIASANLNARLEWDKYEIKLNEELTAGSIIQWMEQYAQNAAVDYDSNYNTTYRPTRWYWDFRRELVPR